VFGIGASILKSLFILFVSFFFFFFFFFFFSLSLSSCFSHQLHIEMAVSLLETNLFDFKDPNFFPWAFVFVAMGPFTWNIIARLEFHTHFLSKLFGSRLVANYVLAFYILGIGFYRDYCFTAAVASQPRVLELESDAVWSETDLF
jgi:hypothetical protein